MKNQQDTYIFQSDWFSAQIPLWEKHLSRYTGKADIQFAEVGSFEGRSAVWLLEHILIHETARLTCIDTFEGSPENAQKSWLNLSLIEAHFDANIKQSGYAHKVTKMKMRSQDALRRLAGSMFDCIYIDGSHTSPDVLTDAVFAWPLIKTGGVMILDDYEWSEGKDEFDRPQMGIDAFLTVFAPQMHVLYKGIQVIVEKR